MAATEDLASEPIFIRYDGLDATGERIDLALLGLSLQGAARMIAVAGHIVSTGVYVSRAPAIQVRVLAGTPRDGCYEVPVYLSGLIPTLPFFDAVQREATKHAVEAVVNYFLARLGGNHQDRDAAIELATKAIEANRDVNLKAMDTVVAALTNAANDQRPAARNFAAPVGESTETAKIGRQPGGFVVDRSAKDRIEYISEIEIGPSQTFTVRLSELDVVTGNCKVQFQGEGMEARRSAHIADPIVNNPRSPYSTALDSQNWIRVVAKPHIKDGDIERLTISDIAA